MGIQVIAQSATTQGLQDQGPVAVPLSTPACTIRQAGVRYARKQMMSFYGLWPMPPSSVRVSPDIYLKSGMASWTQTRPISVSALP